MEDPSPIKRGTLPTVNLEWNEEDLQRKHGKRLIDGVSSRMAVFCIKIRNPRSSFFQNFVCILFLFSSSQCSAIGSKTTLEGRAAEAD